MDISPFSAKVGSLLMLVLPCGISISYGGVFGELPERVRSARAEFCPINSHDVAEAKAGLVAATNQLNTRLDASKAHGRSWRDYLLWKRLAAQLAPDASPDLATLSAILARFQGDYDSLEMPVFVRVRHALERYCVRLQDVGRPELREEFLGRLDSLARLMESCDRESGPRCFDKIGLQLLWLQRHGQIPAIVSAVRASACQPNLAVSLSNPFIAAMTAEAVDRTDPMTDCVLGTTVHGMSQTSGQMEAVPVPSRNEVRLQTRFRGTARTWGRGFNGPVRTEVVGNASLFAQGEIQFGPDGFGWKGADAHVSATGRPTSMWTVFRGPVMNGVVTRIAQKRAARTQALSDHIVSRHAEQRLKQQVSEEVRGNLDRIQREYVTRLRNPLLRRDAFPSQFHTESTDAEARLALLIATPCQLGAAEEAPVIQDAAFALQVHESAIDNLAATFLAGETVSELQIRELIGRLVGQTAADEPVDSTKVLHITLADERPISLQFENQTVTIRMRAQRFIVNRRKYYPMNVLLRYRLQLSSKGVSLTQVDEPEITPPRFETDGPGRLGTREIASRRLIRKMLDRELQKEYVIGTFVLPEPADAFGAMVVRDLVAGNGWLSIASDAAPSSRQTTPK
jgi:hypothetical protein